MDFGVGSGLTRYPSSGGAEARLAVAIGVPARTARVAGLHSLGDLAEAVELLSGDAGWERDHAVDRCVSVVGGSVAGVVDDQLRRPARALCADSKGDRPSGSQPAEKQHE